LYVSLFKSMPKCLRATIWQMDPPLLAAGFQVVVGGVLVFLTGILIGSA
jgi:hypothetical protein